MISFLLKYPGRCVTVRGHHHDQCRTGVDLLLDHGVPPLAGDEFPVIPDRNTLPGKELRQLKDLWAHALAFSPNGRFLASAGGFKTIRIWDVAAGKEVHQLKGHQGTVKALAFSPDGTLLASVGTDGTCRNWDVATGMPRCALRVTGRLVTVAWHPDGSHLCAAGAGSLDLQAGSVGASADSASAATE